MKLSDSTVEEKSDDPEVIDTTFDRDIRDILAGMGLTRRRRTA